MFKKILALLAVVIVGFGVILIFDYLKYSSTPMRGHIDTSKIEHKMSLDDLADRRFLYQKNGADDLVSLIDLYNEKYGGIDEASVDLDDDVLNLLGKIGASEKIDFYEKHHILPDTIPERMSMELLPLNNIRKITRRAVAKADLLVAQGKDDDAKRILEDVLIMGRFLQEDDTITLYILVGLDVERQAAEALIKISSGSTKEKYTSYLLEIAKIKEDMIGRINAMSPASGSIFGDDDAEGEWFSYYNFAVVREAVMESENKFVANEAIYGLWYYSSFLNALSPFNWVKIFAAKRALRELVSKTDDDNLRLIAKDILENGRMEAFVFKKALRAQDF